MKNDHTGEPTNLTVLRGPVRGDAAMRTLPSGAMSLQFDVATTIGPTGRTTNMTVPVVWIDPPTSSVEWANDGTEVLVIGTVRRRFFRVGGATQSRTEVVADVVIPTRRRKQVGNAIDAVVDRLHSS